MPTIEQRLEKIEVRNAKVELDKAWETSWTRKLVVAGFTYVIVSLFFVSSGIARPWLNAIVPTLGFILSTLSLPYIKKLWIAKITKRS